MALNNGQAGIDCLECGYIKTADTAEKAKELSDSLRWHGGDPLCPDCGQSVTFEHYIDL